MAQEVEIVHFKAIPEKNTLFRFTNNGLDLKVVEEAFEAVKARNVWLPVWMEVGDMYHNLGEDALRENHRATAGEYFIKAALGYHYAQYFHFWNAEEKQQAQQAKVKIHAQARPLVDPPIQRLEASFEGVTIPIHVRTPSGSGPYPTVILVCGMDSTKEEYFYLENYLLGRGLAVVAFDGPGQGEVWPHMKMRPDFYKAVSLVADTVGGVKKIDKNRLFLLGLSLGGLLAPLSAAHDPRFKGCIGNGGFFDMTHFDWKNPIRAIGLPYLLGVETVEQAKELAKKYTLAPCIQKAKAPFLIIHGGLDRDAPPESPKRIVDDSRGGGKFVVFPEGIHMCHNIPYKVKPLIADWLMDQANKISPSR